MRYTRTASQVATVAALLTTFVFVGCDSDDDNMTPATQALEVPESYFGFEGVDYSGQQSRLAQLAEMKGYMSSAAPGQAVDSTRLSAMFRNANSAGFSRDYTKQLADKTFEPHQADYERYFGAFARTSTSQEAASEGTAGFGEAGNGKIYLLDANGVEYIQVIEKGLMGATLYYQATSVYLGEDKMSADNTPTTSGEATAREHHWDEAFGYFGVPQDFPSSTEGVVFWGDYCNDRDEMMGTNAIMNAFLRGRAGITANREAVVDSAIQNVRQEWERVVVGTTIHYLNQAIAHADDAPRRMHDLTEAIAFARALVYNEGRTLSASKIDELMVTFAGAANYADMQLYSITDADISTLRSALASAHGITSPDAL